MRENTDHKNSEYGHFQVVRSFFIENFCVNFRGGSRTPATSKMELFTTIINRFQSFGCCYKELHLRYYKGARSGVLVFPKFVLKTFLRLRSSIVYEGIRTILNLFCFFFTKRFHTHKKHTRSIKSVQSIKSLKSTKNAKSTKSTKSIRNLKSVKTTEA